MGCIEKESGSRHKSEGYISPLNLYQSYRSLLSRHVGERNDNSGTYRPSISLRVIVPYVHVMWEKGTITLVNIAPQSQPELSFLTLTSCGRKER